MKYTVKEFFDDHTFEDYRNGFNYTKLDIQNFERGVRLHRLMSKMRKKYNVKIVLEKTVKLPG